MVFRIYMIIAILHAARMFNTSMKIQTTTGISTLLNALFSSLFAVFWPAFDIAILVKKYMHRKLYNTMKEEIHRLALQKNVDVEEEKLKFQIESDGQKTYVVSRDEYTRNILKEIGWVPEEKSWTDVLR